jgi:hypothetical protein
MGLTAIARLVRRSLGEGGRATAEAAGNKQEAMGGGNADRGKPTRGDTPSLRRRERKMKQPGALLIALAICLVCLAPSARAGKNTGMSSTKVEATPTEGNQQEAVGPQQKPEDEVNHKDVQYQRSDTPQYPYAITCAVAVQEPRYALRSGAAGNQQEPVGSSATAGDEQEPIRDLSAIARRAAAEAAGNKQKPPQAKGMAGNQQEPRYPPGAKIPVPRGQSPTDICPKAAIKDRFYHIRPGVIYQGPWAFAGPPPSAAPKNKGGGH